MDYRELNEIHVTWELAAVLCGFLGAGITGAGLVAAVFADHSSAQTIIILTSITAVCILFVVLGLRSRLKKVRAAGAGDDEVSAIVRQILIGVGVIVGGALAIFLVSRLTASTGFYLLPTGLFATGLVLIARAMVSETQE